VCVNGAAHRSRAERRSQIHRGSVAGQQCVRSAAEWTSNDASGDGRRGAVRHGAERHQRQLHHVRHVPASQHQGQGDARRHFQGLRQRHSQRHPSVQRQVCGLLELIREIFVAFVCLPSVITNRYYAYVIGNERLGGAGVRTFDLRLEMAGQSKLLHSRVRIVHTHVLCHQAV